MTSEKINFFLVYSDEIKLLSRETYHRTEIDMSYNKTFEVGKKDNERYNFYCIQRKTIIMSIMVFIIIVFSVTLVQLTKRNLFLEASLAGIAFGLAGIIFFITVNYLIVKYKLYILYKNGSIKTFRQEIILDDSGIHAKTERGSVDVFYSQIKGLTETRHAFYISITTEHVYVFPKDQMNGETEYQEIRNEFRQGMAKNKLKLLA